MRIFILMLMCVCVCFSQTATSSLSVKDAKTIARSIIETNPTWKIGNVSNTNSMYPTLDYNTVLLLEPVTDKTILKKNDIVLFGSNILHRIIEVSPTEGYLIKGDNTKNSDGYVLREDIFYRVVIIFNTE